jgi:integrase
MTQLHAAVEEYLTVRRALGFKLASEGHLLAKFVDFLESKGATTVTTELALDWATQPPGASPTWWSNRLSMVRCFARYLSAFDPSTEVPPTDLLPNLSSNRRATPYLYSEAQLVALMAAARGALSSPLRSATLETLIGLLAVTGMRVGEVIGLDRDDVDWTRGVLTVRRGKFGKSREIPLHPSTLEALRAFARLRDERCPHPQTPSFFVSTTGNRVSYSSFAARFRRLARSAGLQPQSSRCRPRIHDYADLCVMPTLGRKSLQAGMMAA